jgi:FAD/FMN-containing dehydrogenase
MKHHTKRSQVAEKLRKLVAGDVLCDEKTLRQFSRDQSIYEISPLAVVFPARLEDIQETIRFASIEGLPVTPRGGGSGTAGSALGQGIIIAFRRGGFLAKITDYKCVDHKPLITTGAGLYHSTLQDYLWERGFYLPADPSSARICQIGGNIATKASGPHALKHGSIDRFLEHLEFITARGELVNTADQGSIPARLKESMGRLAYKIMNDTDAIRFLTAREGRKIASGYNLFALTRGLPVGKLMAQLLVGSVGTLGFITGATLRAEPYEPGKAAMLLYFEDLSQAGEAVCSIKEIGAAAIEIMNRETLRVIREKTPKGGLLSEDGHMIFVEFEGRERFDQMDRIRDLLKRASYRLCTSPVTATSEEEIEKLWEIRKQILPVIQHPAPQLRALSVINDVGIDPAGLPGFISDLQKVFKRHETETLIYGHAGSGNLHLRPLFDLSRPGLKNRIRKLADDVYGVVFRYGGTITAEHGMGRLRAPYLEREWGENLFGYMKEIKAIFDPDGIFNPDVMFSDRDITEQIQEDLLTR